MFTASLSLEALQDVGTMAFQLVEDHAGEGEGDPEFPLVSVDQFKQKGVGG